LPRQGAAISHFGKGNPLAGARKLIKPLPVSRVVQIVFCALAPFIGFPLLAMDIVRFKDGETERRVVGQILVEAQDGGLMVQGRDTRIWIVQPADLIEKEKSDEAYAVLPKEELEKALIAELGPGFQTLTTEHYVIVYNTSKHYARWCGQLYERLYNAYYKYWKDRGIALKDPEAPLVAVVFENQSSYAKYAQPELGDAASIIGYYSLKSNRVAMYDLSGFESRIDDDATGVKALQHINAVLSRPESERTVATIIHEATHQLVLNSGLQTRYAPIPLWNSEGLAVFFETPNPKSNKGWSTIGTLNHLRLVQFRDYVNKRRGPDSLLTLIATDERVRDPRLANDAYAEAWAFTFYALRDKKKEYIEYMKSLQKLEALGEDSREARLRAFRDAFGEDLEAVDKLFLKFMKRQKLPGE
jgi:hypothetical protein